MKRVISVILVAATISGAAAPAFAGDKHGSKGGGSHMSSHGGKGGFGRFGGKGLAAGAIGAAFGAILIDALANQ